MRHSEQGLADGDGRQGWAGPARYASPATAVGYELVAAGMLILAGEGNGKPLDYDELERWARVGL